MGWDVELQDRKTGDTLTLKHPFYKRGSNVRADVGQDGRLYQIEESEADLSITFNYSPYYYEAGNLDDRFLVTEDGETKNGGLRALHGKSAYESLSMLSDMIKRIQNKYQDADGNWLETTHKKLVYYDENHREVKDFSAIVRGHYAGKEEVEYTVSEGAVNDYWEATAANAISSLTQMLHMATDCLQQDCVWYIA